MKSPAKVEADRAAWEEFCRKEARISGKPEPVFKKIPAPSESFAYYKPADPVPAPTPTPVPEPEVLLSAPRVPASQAGGRRRGKK